MMVCAVRGIGLPMSVFFLSYKRSLLVWQIVVRLHAPCAPFTIWWGRLFTARIDFRYSLSHHTLVTLSPVSCRVVMRVNSSSRQRMSHRKSGLYCFDGCIVIQLSHTKGGWHDRTDIKRVPISTPNGRVSLIGIPLHIFSLGWRDFTFSSNH